VDDSVAIGSRKELANLSKSVDAKYGITGPGEVKWVHGMLLERDRSARRSPGGPFIETGAARVAVVGVVYRRPYCENE